jgi:hypothetical protein
LSEVNELNSGLVKVSSVEGWQLNRGVQGRLRRDSAIIVLTFDKSSVAGYSPDGNEVSAGS